MANFKTSPIFSKHDDYYTPKWAWERVTPIIKKMGYKRVYEPMLLGSNAQSVDFLKELGFSVIGDTQWDFLNDKIPPPQDYDIILSNPPYDSVDSFPKRNNSLKYKIIKKLIELDKPFIIILNSTNLFSKWFRELFAPVAQYTNFIYPDYKIEYDKYEPGGMTKLPDRKEYQKEVKISGAKFDKIRKAVDKLAKDDVAGRESKKNLMAQKEGIPIDIYDRWLTLGGGASFNSIYVCFKAIPHNIWIGEPIQAKFNPITSHINWYSENPEMTGYKEGTSKEYNVGTGRPRFDPLPTGGGGGGGGAAAKTPTESSFNEKEFLKTLTLQQKIKYQKEKKKKKK